MQRVTNVFDPQGKGSLLYRREGSKWEFCQSGDLCDLANSIKLLGYYEELEKACVIRQIKLLGEASCVCKGYVISDGIILSKGGLVEIKEQ